MLQSKQWENGDTYRGNFSWTQHLRKPTPPTPPPPSEAAVAGDVYGSSGGDRDGYDRDDVAAREVYGCEGDDGGGGDGYIYAKGEGEGGREGEERSERGYYEDGNAAAEEKEYGESGDGADDDGAGGSDSGVGVHDMTWEGETQWENGDAHLSVSGKRGARGRNRFVAPSPDPEARKVIAEWASLEKYVNNSPLHIPINECPVYADNGVNGGTGGTGGTLRSSPPKGGLAGGQGGKGGNDGGRIPTSSRRSPSKQSKQSPGPSPGPASPISAGRNDNHKHYHHRDSDQHPQQQSAAVVSVDGPAPKGTRGFHGDLEHDFSALPSPRHKVRAAHPLTL